MFKKILIANRGEIACRIIKSCRQLGIASVAVHSRADADALHVRLADEAVLIGPAPSAESYLHLDSILAAVRQTGADAVHPGYGFLAENAAFCRRLEELGVVFIGPGQAAIAAMGDKITSKRLAQAAGVNIIPGFDGIIENDQQAAAVAGDLGYPVMIKATAGGGGKGMRVARNAGEIREGFRAATSEAKTGFGDDRVFIEKYITRPRHIEIQILGDGQGNVIHLNERECSLQRRHQKVIEEAPSAFITPAVRKKMGEQAVALARAVDYRSAGTVEFIVDASSNFYFLEMNTRLQVEHPVTEQITGVDLVEQMIRIATGEKLTLSQEQVTINGCAIEARVYAEDPSRDFLPSIGRLVHYQEPRGEGIRVDSGAFEGGEVSIHYDPLIAKLIVWAPDRQAAITRLSHALDGYDIRGVKTNLNFLNALVCHPKFARGEISTGFIAEEFPDGYGEMPCTEAQKQLFAAVAAYVRVQETMRATGVHATDVDSPWKMLKRSRVGG